MYYLVKCGGLAIYRDMDMSNRYVFIENLTNPTSMWIGEWKISKQHFEGFVVSQSENYDELVGLAALEEL